MEKFAQADKTASIEGPIMDKEMKYLWFVDFNGGWVSKIASDGKINKIVKDG